MKDLLAELFASKKFVGMIGGVLTTGLIYVAGKAGIGLDPATADLFAAKACALVAVYVGAQGVADHGSTAATIHTEAAAK